MSIDILSWLKKKVFGTEPMCFMGLKPKSYGRES